MPSLFYSFRWRLGFSLLVRKEMYRLRNSRRSHGFSFFPISSLVARLFGPPRCRIIDAFPLHYEYMDSLAFRVGYPRRNYSFSCLYVSVFYYISYYWK